MEIRKCRDKRLESYLTWRQRIRGQRRMPACYLPMNNGLHFVRLYASQLWISLAWLVGLARLQLYHMPSSITCVSGALAWQRQIHKPSTGSRATRKNSVVCQIYLGVIDGGNANYLWTMAKLRAHFYCGIARYINELNWMHEKLMYSKAHMRCMEHRNYSESTFLLFSWPDQLTKSR